MTSWLFSAAPSAPANAVDPVRVDIERVNARIASFITDNEEQKQRVSLEVLVKTTAFLIDTVAKLRTPHDSTSLCQMDCSECEKVAFSLRTLQMESSLFVLHYQMVVADKGFQHAHIMKLMRDVGVEVTSVARMCCDIFYRPLDVPVKREEMHTIEEALATLVANLRSLKWKPDQIQS